MYRYYVSLTALKHGAGACPVGRVPAGEIEAAVIDRLRAIFRQPEIVAGTWKAARAHADLAAQEGIAPYYLTRVLRLTLLAPDIVEAILDGKQGLEVPLARLMNGFPEEWEGQRKSF